MTNEGGMSVDANLDKGAIPNYNLQPESQEVHSSTSQQIPIQGLHHGTPTTNPTLRFQHRALATNSALMSQLGSSQFGQPSLQQGGLQEPISLGFTRRKRKSIHSKAADITKVSHTTFIILY